MKRPCCVKLCAIAAATLGFVSGAVADSDGRSVYESSCIACHGSGGEGTLPGVPDLTEPDGPLSKPEAELVENTIHGMQGPDSPLAMPPKGGNPDLSRTEIERAVRYMRETFLSE